MSASTIFRLLTDMKKNHISGILQELSMVEFTTLHVLKRGQLMNPEGEITVSDLAKYTDSSLPAVSRTLKQLESQHLISRDIGENDRRAISVTLTETGEMMLTREETRLKEYSDFIYETMGKEDVEQLRSLVARFQSISENGFSQLKQS